jgi:hypothetical protein
MPFDFPNTVLVVLDFSSSIFSSVLLERGDSGEGDLILLII